MLEWLQYGASGVWYGIALSNVLAMVAAGIWFLRGTWTDSVVEDEAEPTVVANE
jgi:Na+-driven multidrug efflux pump